MKRSLLLCMMLAGCYYEPLPVDGEPLPRTLLEQEIATWEAQGFSAGTCREQDVVLHVFGSQAELQAWCGLDVVLYACTGGNEIAIIDSCLRGDVYTHIIEHELRHWLSGCGLATIDADHAIDSIWYPDSLGYDVRSDASWGDGCARRSELK